MFKNIFAFAVISSVAGLVFADNISFLKSQTWQTTVIENGMEYVRQLSVDKNDIFTLKQTCLFSKTGRGEDISASVTVPATLTQDRISYGNSAVDKKINSYGYWCSIYVRGDLVDQYMQFDKNTLLFAGDRYTAVIQPSTPQTIAGHKYTFNFFLNGVKLTIVQDLTVPNKLITTATCSLREDVSVVLEAPAEINETTLEMTNPVAVTSNKKYDSAGAWCIAIIPQRKVKFTRSEKGFFVTNDPLHPNGMEWVLVP